MKNEKQVSRKTMRMISLMLSSVLMMNSIFPLSAVNAAEISEDVYSDSADVFELPDADGEIAAAVAFDDAAAYDDIIYDDEVSFYDYDEDVFAEADGEDVFADADEESVFVEEESTEQEEDAGELSSADSLIGDPDPDAEEEFIEDISETASEMGSLSASYEDADYVPLVASGATLKYGDRSINKQLNDPEMVTRILEYDLDADLSAMHADEEFELQEEDCVVSDPDYLQFEFDPQPWGEIACYLEILKEPEPGQDQWFEVKIVDTVYHVDVVNHSVPSWQDLEEGLLDLWGDEVLQLTTDISAGPNDSGVFLGTLSGEYKIALDLNGHTIDASGMTDGYAIQVYGGAALTIMDSSPGQTGKITGANGAAAIQISGGTLVLESGNITGNNGASGGGVLVSESFSTLVSGKSGAFIMNGGTISGNTATGGGGVLVSSGTFTMNGGTISGNTTVRGGGGVYVADGVLHMNGGTIEGNTAGTYGGGIYVGGDSSCFVSGAPSVTGNNVAGAVSNIYLNDENVIRLEGPLGEDVVLSLSANISGRVITAGFPGNGAMANLKAEQEGWEIRQNDAGEAVIGKPAVIRFLEKEGDPTGKEFPVMIDQAYEMPEPSALDYTAPEGSVMLGWKMDDGSVYDPGETVTITGETMTAAAVWGDPFRRVRFEAGNENASGFMKSVKVTYGQDYTLPDCGFTFPEGHVFAGWKVGDETKQAGDTVTVLEDIVVTALWEPSLYTITFSANGGEGSIDSFQELYGREVTLPECSFTPPEGKFFGSWSVQGRNNHFLPGDTFDVRGDTVVKPRWVTLWGDLQRQIDQAPEGAVLTLQGDTLATSNDGWLVVPEGKDVVIDLNGYTLDRNLDKYAIDSVIYVQGSLTIRDSSAEQTGKITGGTDHGILVEEGTLILEGGSICGNSCYIGDGGGICVESGEFTMTGGSVCDNVAGDGGGIYCTDTYVFLKGGSVKNNSCVLVNDNSNACGGGLYITDSVTEMTGGRIEGNYAERNGGGLFFLGGVFEMSGGEIVGNSAKVNCGGLFLGNSSSYKMNSELTGGKISENHSDTNGGGIYLDYGTKTTISGDLQITGNTAARYGGGIYNNGAPFTLEGGIVTGNSANYLGGGIALLGAYTFKMAGAPTVSDNTDKNGDSNLELGNHLIHVTGSLLDAASVGVTYNKASGGRTLGTITDGLKGNGTILVFSSDDEAYLLGLNKDGEAVLDLPVTVTFDTDGGSEVPEQIIASGSVAAMPDKPENPGFVFRGWHQVQEDGEPAEETFSFENTDITGDVTIKALWEDEITAAEKLKEAVEELPEDLSSEDEAYVAALREEFDQMTDAQKEYLGDETVGNLAGLLDQAKEKVDRAKADDVENMINDLPADAGLEDESGIKAARDAYDALTPDQQAKVDASLLKKLTNAEKEAAAELKAAVKYLRENLGISDEEDVKALREAFGQLTKEQKAYLGSKALADIDTGITQAEEKIDQAYADAVAQIISALPSDAGLEEQSSIRAARDAYDALTQNQQAKVDSDLYQKLRNAEYNSAAELYEAIMDLPSNPGVQDEENVYALKEAFDSLTGNQIDFYDFYYDMIADEINKAKDRVDQARADAVEEIINTLPENAGPDDESTIKAARDAYNALNEDQKAKMDADALDSLANAETAAAVELKAAVKYLPKDLGAQDEENVYSLKEAMEQLTDEQKAYLGDETAADLAAKIDQAKETVDQAKADAVAQTINALPEDAGLKDESSIQAAREAYDALNEDQKAKVDADALDRLADAETSVSGAKTAADELKAAVENLPEEITAGDEETINALKDKYEQLTDEQKAYLGEEATAALAAKIEQAKEKVDQAKADAAAKEAAAAEEAARAAAKEAAAVEEAARIAAAKAAFRLNVAANKTVPVQLKKNVKKVKATLGEGDAIASVTSSNAKYVKAGFSGKTITLKGLKNRKSAVITVTTKLGAQISFTVKVQKKAVKTKSIKVTKKVTVKAGQTLDLGVLITPVTTLDKLSFKTSSKKIVTVTKAGVIKARKAGTAKITIKSGKKKKTVKVKVEK